MNPRELQFDRAMTYYINIMHEIQHNPRLTWKQKFIMFNDLIKMAPKVKQHLLYFVNVYDKPVQVPVTDGSKNPTGA